MSQAEANEIVRDAQRLRRARRALKLALPTAAALGAGAAIAVGSIPGSDGTITGCYANKFNEDQPEPVTVGNVVEAPGALRVIDPAGARLPTGGPNPARECVPGESTITWNQRGPTGPVGPQGPAGAGGAPGTPGAPGQALIGATSFGIGGAGSTFLKLDGIKGESTDKAHAGEIAIESFSLSAQGSAHASGGGGGAGRTISSFTITKRIDKASPLLFQAASTGKVIKDAVLAFARKAGGKQQYLKFDFNNVLVSSVIDGQGASQVPTEQISFSFQKCTETFYNGNKASLKLNFNVQTNAKL